jgi:hypothetical protein
MSSLYFTHSCLHLNLPKANNELGKITKFYHIREIMFRGCGGNTTLEHFLETFAVGFHYYWKPFGVILKKNRGI